MNKIIIMDLIKLFSKKEKLLEIKIHALGIYYQNIGIGSGMEKCTMLIKKSGKRLMTNGMELPK